MHSLKNTPIGAVESYASKCLWDTLLKGMSGVDQGCIHREVRNRWALILIKAGRFSITQILTMVWKLRMD